MDQVESLIYEYEGKQREIMLFVHRWLTEEPNVKAKIRFKIPFYYRKSWVCYLNPKKNGAIEFAFTRGNELSNHQGILEAKGRKQVRSIEIFDVANIPLGLTEIVQESLLLDEQVPYGSKRRPKPKF